MQLAHAHAAVPLTRDYIAAAEASRAAEPLRARSDSRYLGASD
jgi:hypothetical protein